MRRIVFALAALTASTSFAYAWPQSTNSAAIHNQQQVYQLTQRLVSMVRTGQVTSGAQTQQYWQQNYRPQIPSYALGGMPRRSR